jgi:hypothetical protein
LTNNTSVDIDTIVNDTKTSLSTIKSVLNEFQNSDFIIIKEKIIEANSFGRIMLSVKALELGADIENVTSLLHWKEFEGISALALERNNFLVRKNFRFTYLKKRNEIDIIGLKKPIVLCIDCKHWHKEVNYSSLKNIVPNQIRRTKDLIKFLPNISTKLECASWEFGIFIPAILSLVSNRHKFYNSVPIIPILKFQDFLNQLLGNIQKIKFFKKRFQHLIPTTK